MTLSEMNFVLPNLYPAAAEIFLLAVACVILVLDVFLKNTRRTLTFVLTIFALLGTAVIVALLPINGEGIASGVFYTFSNMFVSDLMAGVLKLLVCLTVIVVIFYAREYMLERAPQARGEFYSLSLFATLGMMVMISANHFLVVYLGLELLSLSLYAMVALHRDSVQATEAAMKYFILGALASGLLLYGMSMIYGATGTLEITAVARSLYGGEANMSIMSLGLVFLVAGLAFKLGVVPFHMWIPDVYHGAPTAVTLFIASAPKLAAFAITMRMLVSGMLPLSGDGQQMLILLSVLSMALGNLAAIAQTNLKRMLAYSAISHMGFMLLGIVSGVVGTGDQQAISIGAYTSSMFYVVTYVFTSLGSFGMILLLAHNGFESDKLEDLKGLNKRSPWFAAIMMMLMLSMAGIPPFVGFFAKALVLYSVIGAGHRWLAILAVIFSLIGAFYYLRVVKLMYFDEPNDTAPIQAPMEMKFLASLNGLAVAVLGIFPQKLMALCGTAVLPFLFH